MIRVEVLVVEFIDRSFPWLSADAWAYRSDCVVSRELVKRHQLLAQTQLLHWNANGVYIVSSQPMLCNKSKVISCVKKSREVGRAPERFEPGPQLAVVDSRAGGSSAIKKGRYFVLSRSSCNRRWAMSSTRCVWECSRDCGQPWVSASSQQGLGGRSVSVKSSVMQRREAVAVAIVHLSQIENNSNMCTARIFSTRAPIHTTIKRSFL